MLTAFPKTTTGDDKGVVQGDEGALTSNTIAKGRLVRVPDELRPISVDDAGPGLEERIFDTIQEGRIGIEIGDGNSLQLETLAREIRVDELLDLAIGGIGSVNGGEVCEDVAGRFVRWFVDESLLIRI